MKAAVVFMLASALCCSTGCSASRHDFGAVVTGVEQRYSVHAQRIPLMGAISLCARFATRGGVRDIRIAQFENIAKLDADGLYSMMHSELGPEWQPMVRDRERSGSRSETSVIFARPDEDSPQSMRMMIADYENGELNLVRLDMNGQALVRWMKDRNMQGLPFQSRYSVHRQTD